MSLLNEIDARADVLLAQGVPTSQAWSALMSEFPGVHSNVIAERVAAAHVAAGGSL